MVNILSPKSIYVDNNDASTYILSWEGSIEGQTDYEIMYKEKGSDAWFTTGKVTSTNTSYDLRNIHTILDIDFSEIQYKVKLYYSKSEDDGNGNSETTTGTEESNVYSLIFNQGISGNLNVWTGSEKRSYPVFNEIKNTNLKKINFATSEGFKSAPLVDEDSILSSNLKIRVRDDEIRSVASNNPKFTYYTPSESDVFGNFYVNGRTSYAYDESYRYSFLNYWYRYYSSSSLRDTIGHFESYYTYERKYSSSYYYYRWYVDPVYAYKQIGSTSYWAITGYGSASGSTTYYYWRTDPVFTSYITYYRTGYTKEYSGLYYYYSPVEKYTTYTSYYYYYYYYYGYIYSYSYSYKYRTAYSSTNYSYEFTS